MVEELNFPHTRGSLKSYKFLKSSWWGINLKSIYKIVLIDFIQFWSNISYLNIYVTNENPIKNWLEIEEILCGKTEPSSAAPINLTVICSSQEVNGQFVILKPNILSDHSLYVQFLEILIYGNFLADSGLFSFFYIIFTTTKENIKYCRIRN